MRRREFISLLGGAAAAWPLAARAQQAGRVPTIGYLGGGTAATQRAWLEAFVQRLRELGWIEGRTVTIEYRWAESRPARYAEIAAEFVRLKVDVILAVGTEAAVAAKAGDVGHSDRLPDRGRPSCQPPGCFPGAAGRQRHWPVEPGKRSCRQAARNPARGFPRPASVGQHDQCRLFRRRNGEG